MNEQIPLLRERLKEKLSPSRYEHSLSVSYTCISLAMRYGGCLEQAELAGLLHDCAKRYDDAEIARLCLKQQLKLTEAERKAPAVLHAKYGAWMAEHKFNIHDREILSAIACHTTGKQDMGRLDKLLYVADFIEPRRDKADSLEELRRLAYVDLDETLFRILEGTLSYLGKLECFINPLTLETYHYYQALREEGGKDVSNVKIHGYGKNCKNCFGR